MSRKPTHGHTRGDKRTAEYKAWDSMKDRCRNPKHQNYTNYGARGITICSSWLNSFEQFFADVGKKPAPEYQLERIDNNAGYTPENVRWATRKEQARNRRTCRMVGVNGRELCLSELAEFANLPRYILRNRLDRGWPLIEALNTPIRKYPKAK